MENGAQTGEGEGQWPGGEVEEGRLGTAEEKGDKLEREMCGCVMRRWMRLRGEQARGRAQVRTFWEKAQLLLQTHPYLVACLLLLVVAGCVLVTVLLAAALWGPPPDPTPIPPPNPPRRPGDMRIVQEVYVPPPAREVVAEEEEEEEAAAEITNQEHAAATHKPEVLQADLLDLSSAEQVRRHVADRELLEQLPHLELVQPEQRLPRARSVTVHELAHKSLRVEVGHKYLRVFLVSVFEALQRRAERTGALCLPGVDAGLGWDVVVFQEPPPEQLAEQLDAAKAPASPRWRWLFNPTVEPRGMLQLDFRELSDACAAARGAVTPAAQHAALQRARRAAAVVLQGEEIVPRECEPVRGCSPVTYDEFHFEAHIKNPDLAACLQFAQDMASGSYRCA